jgi:hypothetical protein
MNLSTAKGLLEPALKLIGALGVLLYVVGLVVSNMHFMELGIADFPAFNTRNVSAGALCVTWLFFVAALMALPALFVGMVTHVVMATATPRRKLSIILLTLVVVLFVEYVLLVLVISFSSPALAWAPPWRPMTDQKVWGEALSQQPYVQAAQYFMAVFGHAKVITSLFVLSLFGFLIDCKKLRLLKYVPWVDQVIQTSRYRVHPVARGYFMFLSVGLVFLLMSCFAIDVFPNLKGNLGGHQPQVAQLWLRDAGPAEAKLFGLPLPEKPEDRAQFSIGEVAIWHQSDKLLYVVPLRVTESKPGNEPERGLIALDAAQVSLTQYIHKYVRIKGGWRIVEVGVPPS